MDSNGPGYAIQYTRTYCTGSLVYGLVTGSGEGSIISADLLSNRLTLANSSFSAWADTCHGAFPDDVCVCGRGGQFVRVCVCVCLSRGGGV